MNSRTKSREINVDSDLREIKFEIIKMISAVINLIDSNSFVHFFVRRDRRPIGNDVIFSFWMHCLKIESLFDLIKPTRN